LDDVVGDGVCSEARSKLHWADPYRVYRELRERVPVYREPESGLYCVSRYENVAFALRSAQLFSSKGMTKMLFGRPNQRPRV
jgi:cytochrome P450